LIIINVLSQKLFIDGFLADSIANVAVAIPSLNYFVGGRNSSGVLNVPIAGAVPYFTTGSASGINPLTHKQTRNATLTSLGTLP